MTQEIRIPYLEVDATKALVYESLTRATNDDAMSMREIKEKALSVLGIEVPEGTGEYDLSDVWGKHVHDINGLEFSKPFHPAIVAAIRNNVEVYKFFFFLA